MKHNCFSYQGFFNFVTKSENLCFINGHFMTISRRYFTKYFKIFPKTEVQIVILRFLVVLRVSKS